MKNHLNQIFIIVSFFSFSLGTIVAICWGVTHGLVSEVTSETVPQEIIAPQAQPEQAGRDVHLSIKLLIPKLK